MNASDLLKSYKAGAGFRSNDVLRPRDGARPVTFEVADNQVVVLEQSCLDPHKYTVVGERESPREPSDRFVKFEINGHDWEKIGRA